MRAEYKRDMSHNYLILHGENPVDTSSYQVRMLTGNAVPSILKCRIQGLDGKFLFYYDITSRQSLASFYEQKKLKASDLKIIFGGFVKIMEEMMEFLLNADQLLLSPEYMYLDVEKQKMYFCCLPGEPKAIGEQFREMTEYFLPKLDHEDAAAVTMGYGIYRKALEAGIQLEMLKEFIYQNSSEEAGEKKKEQRAAKEISAPEADLAEQEPLDFVEKPKPVQKPKQKPKEKKEKNTEKAVNEKLLWAGGCGLGVLVLLGISAAGYLGYMPGLPAEAVLAAGVLLLGSDALGLWISEKKKKKQDETAEWRKKVRKELSGKKETPCDLWNDDEDRRQAAVPYGYEKMRRINTAPDSRENFYTGNELPEEEDYGETMILSVGKVRGPASLVSKEPGELAPIFLEQELTIIGKMENAADVVIPRPTVSRVHARIRKVEEGYFLADLNSRNGTSVNGRMLKANEEYQLQDEDEVDFAEARYVFIE